MSTSPLYQIIVNGADPVTCQALDLVPRNLIERNGEISALTLSQSRVFGQALALQRNDKVRFLINGRCVFAGDVVDPSHSYQPDSLTTTFRVENWWRTLARQPWTYSPYGYVENGEVFSTAEGDRILGDGDDAGTTPDTWASPRIITGKTNLFPLTGVGVGSLTSVQEQIDSLFAYVLDRHPTLLAAPTVAFGASYFPQMRLVEDISVADAIKQTLVVVPAASFYTDYTPAIPQVYCVDSTITTPRVFALGSHPLKTADVTALNEIIPAGIIARVGDAQFNADYLPGFQELVAFGKYPAATRQDGLNVMGLSLDLSLELNNLSNAALVQNLYEQLAVLRGRGTVAFDDLDMGLELKPGQRIELTGDEPTEHGALIIQDVSHDFARGQTTCTVGYPPAVGLDTLKDRAGLFHRGYWGTAFKARTVLPYA
ncbi:hypothetical protein GCM10023213_13900 [Prosthecobacter algae]|uniref:Uncharacterized protein n=1 Tax=Prosthecobacter algae TaxID=1144682 RepID=A0ABP9NYT1_9BACT